jgi:hypothetical protein
VATVIGQPAALPTEARRNFTLQRLSGEAPGVYRVASLSAVQ